MHIAVFRLMPDLSRCSQKVNQQNILRFNKPAPLAGFAFVTAILSPMKQQELIEKIKRLPQDRIAEVEAFIDSLTREPGPDRTALHNALSDYANRHKGTNADLDPDLEAAAVDRLVQTD